MLDALKNISHKNSKNFFLLAGPCAIEGEKMAFEIAEMINKLGDHTVNIIKECEGIGEPYCGTYNNMKLDYFGTTFKQF